MGLLNNLNKSVVYLRSLNSLAVDLNNNLRNLADPFPHIGDDFSQRGRLSLDTEGGGGGNSSSIGGGASGDLGAGSNYGGDGTKKKRAGGGVAPPDAPWNDFLTQPNPGLNDPRLGGPAPPAPPVNQSAPIVVQFPSSPLPLAPNQATDTAIQAQTKELARTFTRVGEAIVNEVRAGARGGGDSDRITQRRRGF